MNYYKPTLGIEAPQTVGYYLTKRSQKKRKTFRTLGEAQAFMKSLKRCYAYGFEINHPDQL